VQSRRYFSERKDRATTDDKQLTASQKHGILYQEDFMVLEDQKVVQVIVGADILKHVELNDFVISMRSFQGGIEWSGLRGSISSAYVMLVPSSEIGPYFYKYLFKSASYIQALQSTSNLVRDGQALRYNNFTQVALPLSPLSEQSTIAAFLDSETVKIDALVSEAQQVIGLLKERRNALISAAVTGKIDVRNT
jgi:type I restriction enzyme S subunit